MASIQDIIYQLKFIKQKSDELKKTLQYDSEQLQQTGSNMGSEAVLAISVALRSLSFAEASMRSMSRACDTYTEKLMQ